MRKLIPKEFEDFSNKSSGSPNRGAFGTDEMCRHGHDIDDNEFSDDDECWASSNEKELSVQYLEDDCDLVQGVDDLDGIHLILRYMFFIIFIHYPNCYIFNI